MPGVRGDVKGHRSKAVVRDAVGIAAAVVVFVGCSSPPRSADVRGSQDAASSKAPIVARFDCDTLALTATFHDDRVVLELPTRAVTLPHVASASGARYSNGSATFWSQGRKGTLELNGRNQTCRERREPWQEAAERGVDFRAVGQEPGWFLEIDNEKQIRVVYDYAEHQLVAPAISPATRGKTVVYDMMVESQHVLITIDEAPCNDAMSGEEFSRSVAVTIGTRTLRGCGRDIAGER